MGGLFTNNRNEPSDATIDVEGGQLYCHRCHFTENTGTAIKATGADSLVGLSFSKFVNNTAAQGLIQATNSRGGFASTSFINNTVQWADGALVALKDGSLFLGRNALFRDNVGGDLLAQDSHFRIDKSLFKGSALNLDVFEQLPPPGVEPVDESGMLGGAPLLLDGAAGSGTEQTATEGTQLDVQPAPATETDAILPPTDARRRRHHRLQEEAVVVLEPTQYQQLGEGSVARLYGASSLRGFNNFFAGTQGPAILALGASNVTLGRPCFTSDAEGKGDARFVEAAALDGDLTLWGACAFPSTSAADNVSDWGGRGQMSAHVDV